jgi:F-type H+-transporting ATPase subunit delta
MSFTKITIRYAQALLDLAIEQGIVERVYDDMELIDVTCHQSRGLISMLHSPVINIDKKTRIIDKIFGPAVHKLTLRFLELLVKKRREQYIDGIASAFTVLYKELKGIKTAYVTSVTQLSKQEKEQVTGILKKVTDKEIELIENLKKELIGGFVVTMDDYQIDQSLSTKIKELRKEFEKNLYIKGF